VGFKPGQWAWETQVLYRSFLAERKAFSVVFSFLQTVNVIAGGL
jgi:hypothetical protein